MASTRIYFEASAPKGKVDESEDPQEMNLKYMSLEQVLGVRAPQNVHFAVAQFRRELIMFPMAWYGSIGNVVQESEYDSGGHFAAWEVPGLLAADVKKFLGKEGPAYGVVAGKDGY